jgi:hypothetical protein
MRPSRVLPPVRFWRGGQAEEGSELTPAGEGAGVLDRGPDRRCGDRADAGNGHQPLGRLVRLDRRRKLPVDRSDGLIERVDLADKRTKCAAHRASVRAAK